MNKSSSIIQDKSIEKKPPIQRKKTIEKVNEENLLFDKKYMTTAKISANNAYILYLGI